MPPPSACAAQGGAPGADAAAVPHVHHLVGRQAAARVAVAMAVVVMEAAMVGEVKVEEKVAGVTEVATGVGVKVEVMVGEQAVGLVEAGRAVEMEVAEKEAEAREAAGRVEA